MITGFLNNAAVLGTISLSGGVFMSGPSIAQATLAAATTTILFSSISTLLLARGLKQTDQEQARNL